MKIKAKLVTYTAIVVSVHDLEHAVSHETETVSADETKRLLIILQSHAMVHRLSLEPLSKLVDLVVIHLEFPGAGDFLLDVKHGLLETLFAYLRTAAEAHYCVYLYFFSDLMKI